MKLWINGEGQELPAGVGDVERLLAHLEHVGSAGIAVAINGVVVRRADWSSRELADGDRVDIVGATQGG